MRTLAAGAGSRSAGPVVEDLSSERSQALRVNAKDAIKELRIEVFMEGLQVVFEIEPIPVPFPHDQGSCLAQIPRAMRDSRRIASKEAAGASPDLIGTISCFERTAAPAFSIRKSCIP
jgi:hypothetical protein